MVLQECFNSCCFFQEKWGLINCIFGFHEIALVCLFIQTSEISWNRAMVLYSYEMISLCCVNQPTKVLEERCGLSSFPSKFDVQTTVIHRNFLSWSSSGIYLLLKNALFVLHSVERLAWEKHQMWWSIESGPQPEFRSADKYKPLARIMLYIRRRHSSLGNITFENSIQPIW